MITSNKLQQSASSNSLLINKSNRKFLVFSAFLLILLLGSSLQRLSSYLPNYDRRTYQRALMGRKFFRQDKVTKIRTQDFVHEARHAVHTEKYRDQALYCDRSHYRTDLCVASSGDVRVLGGTAHGGSYKVLVVAEEGQERLEKVKPYTRKWETGVMDTIDEVMVIKKVITKQKVFLNRSSSTQDGLQVLQGSHDLDTSTWLSSLQENTGAMASSNQSAELQRKLIPQNIKMRQKQRHNSSAQNHQKRLQKRRHMNDSNGSSQRPHLQEARRSAIREDEVRVQQEVEVRAVPERVSGADLQGRKAEVKPANHADRLPDCEVQHEVPAILFSTGGYTGNVYHEFNDGLIPLFITAQQYTAGEVVLAVLEYHSWWMRKYAEVVAQISNYTVIDLAHDKRVHCFPEVTIGLRIHGELAIHAENRDHASIAGFQSMLRAAYDAPRLPEKAEKSAAVVRSAVTISSKKRPIRLLLISRSSPRAILNEGEVIAMAREMGFAVEVLAPTPRMRMADIYRAVSRSDVMVGVHGAALTHLVFMKPGATLIQVVPLGADWAAATYYGEPAQKLGLNYVAYKVRPRESSLWGKYARDDPVLVSPESVNQKGWWETKRVYLQAQDVTISLPRMRVTLLSAHARALL